MSAPARPPLDSARAGHHSVQWHRAEALCQATVYEAIAFLADGAKLGRWALGCWDTQDCGNGTVRGHSLFDGQSMWVQPIADAVASRVTYLVGATPDALLPRIHAEVSAAVSTEVTDSSPRGDETLCRISLCAERLPDMDDARWQRLVHCHEVEVLLIQGQLALARATYRRSGAA